MKIKWLGHASFLITSDSGIRIITDPYTTGDKLSYGEIKESAEQPRIPIDPHNAFRHDISGNSGLFAAHERQGGTQQM